MSSGSASYVSALEDFRRLRSRATLEGVMAQLTGKSNELLSYDEVRRKLKVEGSFSKGLQDIPLDAIVGSVGRCTDFTRSFLPRRDSDQSRWARVKAAMTDMTGAPPIEVYQIGEAYFVLDGNHRVSVARELGMTYIQAYVTQVRTKVGLSPDIEPDELIHKAMYAEFLERTELDKIRPKADLSVSVPGRYRFLEEDIEVHRHLLSQEEGREIPYEEAVAHWYDNVYSPVVQVIRQRGILKDFPNRTETDLYVWVLQHRTALQKALGWEIEADEAVADLSDRFSSRPDKVVTRVGGRILDAVIPDELESGPSTGKWRKQRQAVHQADRLFSEILVPVSGEADNWPALNQAIKIAWREEGRLQGLYVASSAEQRDSEQAKAMQTEFKRRCEKAGVLGEAAIDVGEVARKICERTHWTDMVVLHLAHPPRPQPLAKMGSGIRTLIRRCGVPVLLVPGEVSPLKRILLAYDGSSKAKEAFFVATYLAGRWEIPLVVVTVQERGQDTLKIVSPVQNYLEEREIEATYVEESGSVAKTILKTAETHHCDLIIMGGYGANPVVEVVLGSTVDQLMRDSQSPMLVCR